MNEYLDRFVFDILRSFVRKDLTKAFDGKVLVENFFLGN